MKKLFKILSFLLVLFYFGQAKQVNAQTNKKEYKNRIAIIKNNIDKYFYDSNSKNYKEFNKVDEEKNKYCYLWPLCALVQAANEAAPIIYDPNFIKTILKTIYHYEDSTAPAIGYASYLKHTKADRFYDDNEWIGLACMDAFERTGDKHFLTEGKKIYNFIITGYDTLSGGGLYWKEGDHSTKNTCSNGPAIILALQIYKATKQKIYLNTALSLFNWTNKYLLSPDNIYYDNLQLPSLQINKSTFTYNTGTMLQSNLLLYQITHKYQYLAQAQKLAEAGYNHFYKNNRWPNNYWFNAVLLRAYISLYKYDRNKKYINAFKRYADIIWLNEKDEQHLIGDHQIKRLIDQAAMMEIYARLFNLSN